jgi:hypothetical protein
LSDFRLQWFENRSKKRQIGLIVPFGLFNLFEVLSVQDEIIRVNSCLMTVDLDPVLQK